jgi:hypothetical protein
MTVTVEFVPAGFVSGVGRTESVAAPVRPARRARPVRRQVATGRGRVVAGSPSCVAAAEPIAASSAVQLTRRGWTVLLSVATAVAAVLVWLAWLAHPAAAPVAAAPAGSQVVVQSGDTLWSIAGRIAPGRDPRAVVYQLQQANHLGGSTVVAGQVLQVG